MALRETVTRGPSIDYMSVCQLKAIYVLQSLFGSHVLSHATQGVYNRILVTQRETPAQKPLEIRLAQINSPGTLWQN